MVRLFLVPALVAAVCAGVPSLLSACRRQAPLPLRVLNPLACCLILLAVMA